MRLVLVLALVLGMVGCGPSSGQIRAAKTAQYNAPPKHLLDLALQVTQFEYKIGAVDPDALKFSTEPQWYSPEGGRISAYTEGNGDFVNAGGGDVQVFFVVRVRLIENNRSIVEITPRAFEIVAGSPQPRELKADDPNLPPWVHGRVDSLALAIYEEARKRYLPPGG